MNLKKIQLITSIVAVGCVAILIVSIVLNASLKLNQAKDSVKEFDTEEATSAVETEETSVEGVTNDVSDEIVEVLQEDPTQSTKPQNLKDNTNTQTSNPGIVYAPADANQDGYVSTDEEMRYITPEKQACIDAGYGVVVEIHGGEWYAVLTHGDGYVNGKSGSEILREYLATLDKEPSTVGGCWINSEKDWYWWMAEDIHELITPDDEEYWEW